MSTATILILFARLLVGRDMSACDVMTNVEQAFIDEGLCSDDACDCYPDALEVLTTLAAECREEDPTHAF